MDTCIIHVYLSQMFAKYDHFQVFFSLVRKKAKYEGEPSEYVWLIRQNAEI